MKNFFEIKVCGINDIACMNTALNLGVEYIGLVFYDRSPRNVSVSTAKKLVESRNGVSKIVALTVNANDNFLFEIKKNIKPDYFQLHGHETPERCRYIKEKLKTPIIKGLGVKKNSNLNIFSKKFEEVCDILILDSPSEELPGGNGKSFDWKILKDYKSKIKWMLAGGLNIKNIGKAIEITKPPAIDISSGLEINKGIKDPKLINDFVYKCKKILME